jgi:hypothetical protein
MPKYEAEKERLFLRISGTIKDYPDEKNHGARFKNGTSATKPCIPEDIW